MANKDYADSRQYRCLIKYEKIVNQFDELIQLVDATTKPPKTKRRRVTSSPKRSSRSKGTAGGEKSGNSSCAAVTESTASSTAAAAAAAAAVATHDQAEMNGVLVKIITRHLNDLKTDHPFDSASSTSS